MAVKITIPVEFQDSAQSYKQIIASLQAELKKVKPGTAIYDSIKQQINDAEKEIKKVDAKLDLGVISKSEMQSLSSYLNRVDALLRRASDSLKTIDISELIDFSDQELFSGDSLKQIEKYREEIELLENQIKQLNGSKVKDVLKGKANAKFTKEELEGDIVGTYHSLANELARVEEQVSSTNTEYKQLLATTIQASAAIKTFKQTNAQSLDTKKVNEVQTAQRILGTKDQDTITNVRTRLLEEVDKVKNTWNSGGKDFTTQILSYLGIEPTQIANLVSDSFDDTRAAIEKAFASKGNDKKVSVGSLQKAREAISQHDTLIKTAELDRMEADFQEQKARVLELGQLRKILPQLKEKVEILFSEISVTDDDGTEVDVFKKYQEVIQLLQKAIAEARKLKGTTGADDELNAALEDNLAGQERGEAEIIAKQDAEKFKDNLKQAISHWLSAQMIITKVREGIHQAWTDIQGLDKAMTNIAVVTDMSVSDLWGKIDEYMAIAQEYGVTTQGVYEVSQLYYQQGLSTSEVMEATTETLKMARIAGMDYAEAADAMTVAIRAFKMEMSDAQVITDVYSKVAAVTASDSQELAIAMSKTASSAESVGSSFENTTAMLAVMIETTRESAQNLGSALKSIISRYGEMKVGLTVDSEGEEIDYNKVDTALKSVGISIKDAQGQFREFDQVIFELSKKWNSLDKNTQRYIATIMAGNRQQSRFIALVDNWERLEEVSAAAYDSEDAGLLQYAKTLDSLETKLNALSTSFQQFYMSIVNGDTFKGIIDMITNFINGLNKLGSWTSILNIGLLLRNLKILASALINSFSEPMSEITQHYKSRFQEITTIAFKAGKESRKKFTEGFKSADIAEDLAETIANNLSSKTGQVKNFLAKHSQALTLGAHAAGAGLTLLGTSVAPDYGRVGASLSHVGSTLSAGATGFAMGGPQGAIIAAIAAFFAGLPAVIQEYSDEAINAAKIAKAEALLNEAELNRATKKEEARNLASTIENLRKLQKARFSSEEAEKAYIDASNAAFEQFPELTATFDETGNAIIDVISKTSNAEQLLIETRKAAAEAAENTAAAELKLNVKKQNQAQKEWDKYNKPSYKVDTFVRNLSQGNSDLGLNETYYQGKNIVEIAKDYFTSIEAYLLDYAKQQSAELSNEQRQNIISQERKKRENIFFNNLSSLGIDLEEEDRTLRGFLIKASQAEQNFKQTSGALKASQEASLNRAIDEAILNITSNQSLEWLQFDGIIELFYDEIAKTFKGKDQLFDQETSDILSDVKDDIYIYVEQYTEAWDEISNNLTAYQKEDFNELINSANAGSITAFDFIEQYDDYFVNKNLSKEARQQIQNMRKLIVDEIVQTTSNLQQSLIDLDKNLWGEQSNLRVLAKIPTQYFANIYDFAEKINAQLEEGLINETQAKDITSRYLQMWEGLGAAGLDSEALGQARNALASADLFSISGIDTLITTLKDLGIEVENLPGLKDFPVYAVNFTTEYAGLIERMNSGMESLKKLLSNLANGLDTADATELAKKMGTTLSDESAFEFIDGKWYVENVETAVAAIEKTYSGLQEKLKTTFDDSIKKLTTNGEEALQLVAANEENAKKWAAEQASKGITDLPDFEIDDGRSLVAAYLQAEYEGITQAYKTEKEWLIEEATYDLDVKRLARDLAGGEDALRKLEAQNLLVSKGLSGYTNEEVTQLIKALDISKDAFIAKDDGTYDIILDKLGEVSGYVKKALLLTVDNEVQTSIDAISQLGSVAASNKENTQAYAEAFSELFGSSEMAYEDFATYSETIRQAAQRDTNSEDILREAITKQLFPNIDASELTEQDIAVINETYNKLIANTKDALNNNINRYFELAKKQIEGTLTEEERLEIDQLVLPENWHRAYSHIFENEATSIADKWLIFIKTLISDSPEQWSEIEDTVKKGYDEIFKNLFKEKTGKETDIQSSLKSIKDSEGFFDREQLNSIFTPFSKNGIKLTTEDFSKLFNYDELTGKLVYAATKEANEILTNFDPELARSFKQSDIQRQLNEKLRIEDAQKTASEIISELLGNTTDASLENLVKLHKTIYGENAEIDSDTFKNYSTAIENAKRGSADLLTQYVYQLMNAAKNKNIAIDNDQLAANIKDLAREKVNAVGDAIVSGFEGTLSNNDFLTLLNNLNIQKLDADGKVNQEWIDFHNSVISTNDGLRLTSASLYKIYNLLGNIDGYGLAADALLGKFVEDSEKYENIFSLLKHINELREKTNDEDKEVSDARRKEYEKELAVAEAVLAVRSKNPDSFNFMDGNLPDEIQSPLNVWESAAQAAEVLAQAKKTGKIDLTDYYNIITTAAQQLEASGQEFNLAGMNYHQAMRAAAGAMTAANGEIVVDLAKLGTNFSAGMDDMAMGLQEGLRTMAEEQIAIIDSMIAMLETLLTLQQLGDLGGIDFNGNGLFDFAEVFAYDSEKAALVLTQGAQEWLTGIQMAVGFIEIGGKTLAEALVDGLIDPSTLPKIMTSIAEILKGIDIENLNGEGLADIQEKIRQVIQDALTGDGETPVQVDFDVKPELQIKLNEDGTYTFGNTTGTKEKVQAALIDYIKKNAGSYFTDSNGNSLEFSLGEGNVIKFTDSANVEHEITVDTNGDKTTFTYGGTPYNSWEEVQKEIQENMPKPTTTSGETEKTEKTLESGITFSGIGVSVGNQLQINGSATFSSLLDYVNEKLTGTQAKGIISKGFYPAGVYSGIGLSFGDQIQINGNGTSYNSISEYITEFLKEASTTLNEFKGTLTITAETSDADKALDTTKAKLDSIKSKTVHVYVTGVGSALVLVQKLIDKLNELGSMDVSASASVKGSFSSGRSRRQLERPFTPAVNAKGNVALASGNRTTLMGELGPELYVTNGRYYIAGAHGPEFVNLPNDAIVFNHLQTARLLNHGHIPNTGKPVVSEERSVAFAKGTGPAAAGGIEAALQQLYTAREFWQGLLNQLSLTDMMQGSGTGGGGNKNNNAGKSIKAYTEELQEWYNLSRQIADIEQDINNLIAERENIPKDDGAAYLRNLREQQLLLEKQRATQRILLDYQKVQLQRQAEQINGNSIWKRFLHVDENGLLQYIEGNETNGGKGALQVLSELNKMSGKKQTAYLKKIGYSAKDADGKKLEGEDLVKQFFQEIQDQIDQYDSLYDTVNETTGALEELTTGIAEINDEIKENQLDLEESIFDIVVEAWEAQINQMEQQMSIIKEANQKYIAGLNESISSERDLYDQNQTIEEREKLQRQLSLLRRSGGSASEIANLETQLDSMLKEEYFSNQEKMVEQIQEASDKQIEQLENQIKLQEEALAYQKEHGIIWQKVYEIMSQSAASILDFMSGNSPEFFAQSSLQQEEMLTEWARKIGIFTEDQEYKNYSTQAEKLWNTESMWENEKMSSYKKTFNSMSEKEQQAMKEQFISSYSNARLDGNSDEQAYNKAISSASETLEDKKKANDEIIHWRFKYNGQYYKHYLTRAEAVRAINRVYYAEKDELVAKAKTKAKKKAAEKKAKDHQNSAIKSLASNKHIKGYSEGGLVDYTGTAIVHGSKARPESFLNAEQTAQIREGLKLSGKNSTLDGIKDVLIKLNSSIKSIPNIVNKTESNSYTVSPGAVVVQVEQLNDAYDVDVLATDIMNRIYSIGKKSTNRGVSRR